jgi:hypothetical protein
LFDKACVFEAGITMSRRRYAALTDLPDGKFIGYEIWKRDPSPRYIKMLLMVLTIAGLLCMIFSSSIVITLMGMDGTWDGDHGYIPGRSSLLDLMAIILRLSNSTVQTIILVPYGIFGLLIVADIALKADQNELQKNKTTLTWPWPASWKTDNFDCYHEMFAEPTRWGRILRRPGNTLSNVNYLLASLCVLASSLADTSCAFCMADILFAIMLFFLAIFSTIWHASNAPWSQYDDIWSMDCCILYLLIRYCCLGGCIALTTYRRMDTRKAADLAGSVCLMVYCAVIVGLGKMQGGMYRKRFLHGGCPFSGRARLLGKGDLWGQGQHDCHISTVCAFAILPVVYIGIPTAIQVLLVDSVGSVTAANWVVCTLATGWMYRLWDKWVLDGCIFISVISASNINPKWLCTFGAAVFSPTAVLHFFTGLTLLVGYMHCRSVEELAG